ncbi:hypothetical protein [Saccharicrinis sp. GN24d3]|uniref:hypothetical protein n=1 Tax=Saccharicrinis sp. GN24d3 TaxID=3458416 RepID=UPI004036C1E1
MEFGLKDVVYLIMMAGGILASFLGTRHKLKEYIRDRAEGLQKEVHRLELQISDLKKKDELQQQVIDTVGDQMKELIPAILSALKQKEQVNEKY